MMNYNIVASTQQEQQFPRLDGHVEGLPIGKHPAVNMIMRMEITIPDPQCPSTQLPAMWE